MRGSICRQSTTVSRCAWPGTWDVRTYNIPNVHDSPCPQDNSIHTKVNRPVNLTSCFEALETPPTHLSPGIGLRRQTAESQLTDMCHSLVN